MEVAILVGLQGAGKTTFFHQRLAATHVHVSKDNFRNNHRPGRRQRHLIEEALREGRSVAVDNTNATAVDRAELIELAKQFKASVDCYYFPPDVDGSLQRNSVRTGKARVPDGVIHMTARRLEPPSLREGFNRFFEVHLVNGEFAIREIGSSSDATR